MMSNDGKGQPVTLSFSRCQGYWRYTLIKDESRKGKKRPSDEPTLKCQRNPFIGALGIQEPVMPGEPLIEC